MAIVYYPKNNLIARRDTISASFETIVLASSPQSIIYFDTSSGINAITVEPVQITCSWATNAINGGTTLITASTVPITSSWSISSSWAPGSGAAGTSSLAQSASVGNTSTNATYFPLIVGGLGNQIFLIDSASNSSFTYNPSTDTLSCGTLTATMKSFLINHPTKEGKKLQYGNIESPYHGVQLTGREKMRGKKCIVELPDYFNSLVREKGISIQITNIKHSKILYVDEINLSKNYFVVATSSKKSKKKIEFFWLLTAIRKDVPELVTEF